jgi:RNA polymerase sigma factor (sigma-70 family)
MPSLHALEIPADVLARARAGNALAQESIYRDLSKPLYTLIRRLVVRPAIAEELLQDVFVEMLRSLPKYSGTGSFLGWVRSIAVNKALMYLRSPWHRSLSWLGAEGVMALHEQTSVHMSDSLDTDLERALAQLPAISRAVVWLYDVEGLTHAEIARLFGRSISFSKSQLARAHEQLRLELQSESGGLACTPISKHF